MAKRYYNQQNTNAYRFDSNAAYDLSNFEATRSVAPARQVESTRIPKLELVDKPVVKTYNQIRREERQGFMKAMKVMLISVVMFGLLGAVIYGETQKNQLTREISKAQTQLNLAKSENTRLNMVLNSIVSLDNIEQYATEKLGMVKMQNQQITYINISEETAAGKVAEKQAEASTEKTADQEAPIEDKKADNQASEIGESNN